MSVSNPVSSDQGLSHRLVRGLALRHWLSRGVMCLGICLVLTIVDLFFSAGSAVSGPLRLISGSTLALSGSLPTRVPLERLEGRSSPPGLTLRIEAVATGFWFGFPLWRGVLDAQPDAALGPYQLELLLHKPPPVVMSQSVQMRPSAPERVFVQSVELLDAARWRTEHPSRLVRWVGLEPGVGLAFLVFLLLGSLGGLFSLAHRLRLELEAQGWSELEHISRTEQGWMLHFRRLTGPEPALGTHRAFWDRAGRPLGEGVLVALEADRLLVSYPLDGLPPSELWIRGAG